MAAEEPDFRVTSDPDEIPDAPPPELRPGYLRASRSYLCWCFGMLGWSVLCVVYFVLTHQVLEMVIGICLGLLVLAMVYLPAVLFGGRTWYKRLGWMMLLTALFSLMFVYPLIVVGVGVGERWTTGRYRTWAIPTDRWHVALSVLTIVMSLWTVRVTVRVGVLVRRLQRGRFELKGGPAMRGED